MSNVSEAHTDGLFQAGTRRRLNRSCSECTRRKVKCDGQQPCSSCCFHKVSHLCAYRQRHRRSAVKKSEHEELSERLRSRTGILELLFAEEDLEDLSTKSLPELLNILQIVHTPSQRPLVSPLAGPVLDAPSPEDSGPASPCGELATQRQWDESRRQPLAQQAADDINAINLATDQHRRSYLGIGSVSAILRAIFRLCPSAKRLIADRARAWTDNESSQASPFPNMCSLNVYPSTLREQRCIDFYFEHVHAIVPMLDEEDFRATYLAGQRRDTGWLGLLHMVIILGSIASGSDSLHDQYYAQARSYLDLDSLGAGNLESLQAFCLLGGMYLHYRNAPNMGYAILGAAQRMAIALGLHRESTRRSWTGADQNTGRVKQAEAARRTWWSLFCLDTWASMTLGRPTSGRWELDTMDARLPTPASEDDHAVLSLLASCQFCLISTRVQHRFAQFNRLSFSEALAFDQELQVWYQSLPPVLVSTINSPSRLTISREFMRNRYFNIRLILLRSLVVYMVRDRVPVDQICGQALEVVETCRKVSGEAIESIALYWTPNRIHAWNAAWYLFQACMVPVLLIVMGRSQTQPNIEAQESGKAWLMKALETFSEMRLWMRSSDKGPDIISALFEATSTESEESEQTPSNSESNFLGWCDDQLTFTDLDWSLFLNNKDFQGGNLQPA
ncbi:fungal-specific transcription factor domain-containing protein [Paramyrothecium foliicola]|nr:fungal-specific transcription factor domain-containing protein [Paramyrothecium foliicola]